MQSWMKSLEQTVLKEGVYPDFLFRRRLHEEVGRARRSRGLLALAFLKENSPNTMHILRKNLRSMDVVGRWKSYSALLVTEILATLEEKEWSDRVCQISRAMLRLASVGEKPGSPFILGVCILPEKKNGEIVCETLLKGAEKALKAAASERQSAIYRGQQRFLEINEPSEPSAIVRTGDFHMDRDRMKIMIGPETISLRRKEFDLLSYLLKNAGKSVSRESISRMVWDTEYFNSTRTIDLHIAQIRKIIRRSQFVQIHTVKNIGYRLERQGQ